MQSSGVHGFHETIRPGDVGNAAAATARAADFTLPDASKALCGKVASGLKTHSLQTEPEGTPDLGGPHSSLDSALHGTATNPD